VSETGDVEQVESISGDPILAKAALEAAKQWKFKPFIRHGKAIEVSTKSPFNFSFTENTKNAAPSAEADPRRVRVSAGVTQRLKTHSVAPVYPPEAKIARIQGVVVLKVLISKEGTIEDLQVISGHPLLVPAAIGAVQQWRYRPYLLQGEPVKVETQIQVNFELR
jgi:TonB family protein